MIFLFLFYFFYHNMADNYNIIICNSIILLFQDNPGNYYAALSVTFRSLKATKVDSSLFLSSGLERWMFCMF